MPNNLNPEVVSKAAAKIVRIWSVNPDFKIKDVTFEQYQAQEARLDQLLTTIKEKEDELTPLRNERDDLSRALNENSTRARSGIKGYFGDDSSEYELAGGTRASERKRAGARKKVATTAK